MTRMDLIGRVNGTRRATARTLGPITVAGALLVGLILLWRVALPSGRAQTSGAGKNGPTKVELFKGWDKPDVALLLSAQQHGYLQPCGCTSPQYGGLARRYHFLQTLVKERGWNVVGVDAGDIADDPRHKTPQSHVKYSTSLKALKLMDYTAVSIGKNEMALQLVDLLSDFPLNNPSPKVVAANLLNRGKGQLFEPTVASWQIAGKGGAPKVGVFGIVAPSVDKEVRDPDVSFAKDTRKVVEQTLREVGARNADLVVMLYQGTPKEAKACAEFCRKLRDADPKIPEVNVVVCVSDGDTPPSVPEHVVADTMIITLGHKGRYVGVVGASKKQGGFHLRYQLVSIGPEYETPKGKEDANPVMALMEEYAKELRQGDYLAKFTKNPSAHPIQVALPGAEYVGSKECRGCHKHAYDVWAKSGHAHAYETLEKATRPSNRQFDGECIVCHVTGFGYKTGFTDEKKTPFLKQVGCESCHGPGSEHIADTKNKKIHALMNPYRFDPKAPAAVEQRRVNLIDISCQKCHDIDNDVHWNIKKWALIEHRTPKK
jgi:hypothetical protein